MSFAVVVALLFINQQPLQERTKIINKHIPVKIDNQLIMKSKIKWEPKLKNSVAFESEF